MQLEHEITQYFSSAHPLSTFRVLLVSVFQVLHLRHFLIIGVANASLVFCPSTFLKVLILWCFLVFRLRTSTWEGSNFVTYFLLNRLNHTNSKNILNPSQYPITPWRRPERGRPKGKKQRRTCVSLIGISHEEESNNPWHPREWRW